MRRVSLSPQFRSLSCPYFVKRASAPHFNVPFVRARRFTPCYIVGFGTMNHVLYFHRHDKQRCAPARRPSLAAAHFACLLCACCRCVQAHLVSCHHMRAAQRSPIFVRIARRSNQERAETSTTIKLAAAETEHAKTMMTNTIERHEYGTRASGRRQQTCGRKSGAQWRRRRQTAQANGASEPRTAHAHAITLGSCACILYRCRVLAVVYWVATTV